MKANFQINLPSIPGKCIKFKIQDIKSAAFGAQRARFPDNKAILTKKFVESFNNFHESKSKSERDDMAEVDTQAESQMGRSRIGDKGAQFRSMISENKKFLLPLYAEVKKQELEKSQRSLEPNVKNIGGFSFARAGLNSTSAQNQQQLQQPQEQYNNRNNQSLTQNYYFTSQSQPEQQHPAPKKPRPNAVFKNETRKRVEDRILFSDVPGPGTYIRDKPAVPVRKICQTGKNGKKDGKEGLKNYKHLKQVIEKVLVQQGEPIDEDQQIQEKKQYKQDHMFIIDDRDRFGEQIFPIAPKLKVPGPGSYQLGDSIEEKAKRLLLVEQQRKLLKQWFNN